MLQASCEALFKDFNVRENINTLHAVVTEAKNRKQRGEVDRPDLWKGDLDPRAAVRARTIPTLQAEAERLREALKKACMSPHRGLWAHTGRQIEEENVELFEGTQKNVEKEREAAEKTQELTKLVDEVLRTIEYHFVALTSFLGLFKME